MQEVSQYPISSYTRTTAATQHGAGTRIDRHVRCWDRGLRRNQVQVQNCAATPLATATDRWQNQILEKDVLTNGAAETRASYVEDRDVNTVPLMTRGSVKDGLKAVGPETHGKTRHRQV